MRATMLTLCVALAVLAMTAPSDASSTKGQGQAQLVQGQCSQWSNFPECRVCEWHNPNRRNGMPRMGWCKVPANGLTVTDCACRSLSGWQHGTTNGF